MQAIVLKSRRVLLAFGSLPLGMLYKFSCSVVAHVHSTRSARAISCYTKRLQARRTTSAACPCRTEIIRCPIMSISDMKDDGPGACLILKYWWLDVDNSRSFIFGYRWEAARHL